MDRLQIWANEWQMTFNVDKCKTMHFGYGNKDMEYLLDNKVLASVNCEKDLGVWITDDLKPVYHITARKLIECWACSNVLLCTKIHTFSSLSTSH